MFPASSLYHILISIYPLTLNDNSILLFGLLFDDEYKLPLPGLVDHESLTTLAIYFIEQQSYL